MTDKIEDDQDTLSEQSTPSGVCTCDEPFRTGDCPVHPAEQSANYPEAPTPTVTTISAKDRVEPYKKSVWHGFAFKCAECDEPSIMHWGNLGFNFCPACGVKLKYDWED